MAGWFVARVGSGARHYRILAAGSSARTDSRCGKGGERTMTTFFDELHNRFPDLVRSVEEAISDQTVILLNGPDVTGIVRHFIEAHQARIVTVFAEDRVSAEGVF